MSAETNEPTAADVDLHEMALAAAFMEDDAVSWEREAEQCTINAKALHKRAAMLRLAIGVVDKQQSAEILEKAKLEARKIRHPNPESTK